VERKKKVFFRRKKSRDFSVILPEKTEKTVISVENCEE